MRAVRMLLKEAILSGLVGHFPKETVAKYFGINPEHLTDEIYQAHSHLDINHPYTGIRLRGAVANQLKTQRFKRNIVNNIKNNEISPTIGILGAGAGAYTMANS